MQESSPAITGTLFNEELEWMDLYASAFNGHRALRWPVPLIRRTVIRADSCGVCDSRSESSSNKGANKK
jgi:hypothetical protein